MYPVLSDWLYEHRVTRVGLAGMLFISQSTMTSRLNGSSSWSLDEAMRLEQLTGIPINMLFKKEKKQ